MRLGPGELHIMIRESMKTPQYTILGSDAIEVTLAARGGCNQQLVQGLSKQLGALLILNSNLEKTVRIKAS